MTNNQHEAKASTELVKRCVDFTDRYATAFFERFPEKYGFSVDSQYHAAMQAHLDVLASEDRRVTRVIDQILHAQRSNEELNEELEAWESHKGLRKALAKEIGE